MRGSITLASAVLLSAVAITTCGVASAAAQAAGKPAKCTPKKHYGRWKDVKGSKQQYRIIISWPKGSGHVAIGGFCHVNAKGLGNTNMVFRDKPVRKRVVPQAPPTVIVGNPPPDILPVTPPAPPAPPVVPPTPVLTAALSLTETANINDVLVDMNQNVDKFDVSINGIAVGTVTHQANGLAADLPVQAHVGDTAMVCQQTDIFGFLPDGNACQSHTFTDGDVSSKFVFAFHNHKNVQFSCDDLVITLPPPGGTTVLLALKYHDLNVTAIYANIDYGDGTGQHTSLGGDNGQFNAAVVYPGPGQYQITGIPFFSMSNGPSLSPLTVSTPVQPATYNLASKSCTKVITLQPAPAV